ncbi:MAG: IS4 family transposase [Opitutaceae bacterium]
MKIANAAEDDWEILKGFFPVGWEALATEHHATKGLRQDKSPEKLLQVLLMHLGCGFSLRETATRAAQAGLSQLSDVALLKRLRKSKGWLQAMCQVLWEERGARTKSPGPVPLRMVDSTLVKEPGKTGSQWRIHYSLQWPQLKCDFFQISGTEGNGTGESLKGYPLKAGEYVIGDRGFCRGPGLHFAAACGALTLVRLNTGSVKLQNSDRSPFPLLSRLGALKKAGESREWTVWVPSGDAQPLRMRLCAVRKSVASTRRSLKKLYRKASINQRTPDPATLRYAEYVMVITTFPADKFCTTQVLHYYRFRWQIELLFKRLKQLAQLGHLPKHDEESSHAWLYGKLLIALLTDKLIAHARDFSPWGFELAAKEQPVA